MSNYEIFKPQTVKEASDLLKNDGYMPLAGGTDMVVKIKNGFFKNLKAVVYVGNLPFNKIINENNKVIIGSGSTMEEIATNPIIKENYPTLVEAANTVGATQIRHMATIGGNVGNSSPAGDSIPALYSLDAQVLITNGTSQCTVDIKDFFTGPGRNVLQLGELIEAFVLPLRKTTGRFMKLGERSALAISKINLALSTWEDGKKHYRVALGSVAPTVLRSKKAEEILENAAHPLTEEVIQKASEAARETADPITDIRSTKAYRKQMAGVLLRKALEK